MIGLQRQMMRMLEAEGDSRARGEAEVFDDYPYIGNCAKAYDTWLKSLELWLAPLSAVQPSE